MLTPRGFYLGTFRTFTLKKTCQGLPFQDVFNFFCRAEGLSATHTFCFKKSSQAKGLTANSKFKIFFGSGSRKL